MKIKKINYEINPSQVNEKKWFKILSLYEKGIFFEILSIVWSSELQFKIKNNSESISKSIGCKKEELNNLIEKLIESSFAYKEIDLEDMEEYLVIRNLEEQIDNFNKKSKCEIIDMSKAMNSKKDSVSKRVVKCDKINHPEIMHLKNEEKDLSSYQGWMPTMNFDSSGQIYVLPATLLSSIVDEHKNINLKKELNEIFDWFARNPDKRQPVGKISGFIYRWCERSSIKSSMSEESMEDLLSKISIQI